MAIFIGIDDTDSRKGGCTTYIGALLNQRIVEMGYRTEPRLIRLNPNIPWKTRGNAAIAIKVDAEWGEKVVKTLVSTTRKIVEREAVLEDPETNTGVAIAETPIPEQLKDFSTRAVQHVVTIGEAKSIAKKLGVVTLIYGNGRGLIGALAAIGATLDNKTYEIIAYRSRNYFGLKTRYVDKASVEEMDQATYPHTFNNIDPETGKVLITPHSPCPVLYGIRATKPEVLEKACSMVKTHEPIEMFCTFVTNQATDQHLIKTSISNIETLTSVVVSGCVATKPVKTRGGHVFFHISDCDNREKLVRCAAYYPTGGFRDKLMGLVVGDGVTVVGAAKPGGDGEITINLEKIRVDKLKQVYKKRNPKCQRCGKTMTSNGVNKGYKCKRCKTRSLEAKPEVIPVRREIGTGWYQVSPRAMRHLSRPIWFENNSREPKKCGGMLTPS
ncbi:MAG: hypothetical protein DRO11_05465 [Methanobacteriota archaeon]|nr:MAG: hypothetical protein DRO11_05465 [Euryarchaeota archaeon]